MHCKFIWMDKVRFLVTHISYIQVLSYPSYTQVSMICKQELASTGEGWSGRTLRCEVKLLWRRQIYTKPHLISWKKCERTPNLHCRSQGHSREIYSQIDVLRLLPVYSTMKSEKRTFCLTVSAMCTWSTWDSTSAWPKVKDEVFWWRKTRIFSFVK